MTDESAFIQGAQIARQAHGASVMSRVSTYCVALGATAIAVLARWILDPLLGQHHPFVLIIFSVMVTAWYAGWKPAVLAQFVGLGAVVFMFCEPRHTLLIKDVENQVGLVVYFVITSVAIWVTESHHAAKRRIEAEASELEKEIAAHNQTQSALEQANATLEERVNERTANLVQANVQLRSEIVARREAEEDLRTSETRFRLLVEGSKDYAFFMLDTSGHIATWNAGAEQNTGYEAVKVLGQHFSLLFTAEDRANGIPERELEQAMRKPVEDEGWRVRKDGTRFWASVLINALRGERDELLGFSKITRDITDRRRSEVLLTSTLKNVNEGIVGIDQRGNVESFNAAAERMFGYAEQEVLGAQITSLIPQPHGIGHDGDLAIYLRADRTTAIGIGRQLTGRRQDGTTFPLEISVSEFFLYDERHFTAAVRDVTQQKKLEDQLRQAQKMEAIGQLAGGIAHDFNNMLTVVLSYCELLLDDLAPDDPIVPSIQAIDESGKRAAALTRQLLAFSRRAVIEPKPVDINAAVEAIESILRRLIGEDILLTTILAPNLDRVMVDPGQMDQVLMNLAVNSRDAMPQGGRLLIETSRVELNERLTADSPEIPQGRYVQLTMTDTGCGMTPDVKRRLFEPFFTTKGPGAGTGLGLATVYGIVRQSGAHIEVASEVGYGTTFKILLPATVQDNVSQSAALDSAPVEGGTESILVVEDQEAVRSMVARTLAKQGYKVLQAECGRDAIEMGEVQSMTIDLLLTDVVMPEMNGRQLAEILNLRFPDMKVLFMSGYTDDAVIRYGILQAEVAFLQKPFTPSVLAKKVRDVLGGQPVSTTIAPVASFDTSPQCGSNCC